MRGVPERTWQLHCSLLEELYTGPATVDSTRIIEYLRSKHPDASYECITNVWAHQKNKLLQAKAIRRLTAKSHLIIKRDCISKRLDEFLSFTNRPAPVKRIELVLNSEADSPKPAPPPAPEVVGQTYTDRVILAMAETIKQLNKKVEERDKEIAELIDERSRNLAAVHEANAAVLRSKEVFRAHNRLPPGVDLDELGVAPVAKEDYL